VKKKLWEHSLLFSDCSLDLKRPSPLIRNDSVDILQNFSPTEICELEGECINACRMIKSAENSWG
jgi:hypothetical protein